MLINKIRLKFQNLFGFEKLNPPDNFDYEQNVETDCSSSNVELFKKAIQNHPELKEVMWTAFYHCLYIFKSKNEYLTVLNKDFELIADLVEGDEEGVDIPENVKCEMLEGNVLSTFHNHFNGAIIPSSKDLKNTIFSHIRFMVITSQENIGIIINDSNK